MGKIFFWEKLAKLPEEGDTEKILFNEVEEDESIRELIRSLEEKSISKKINFSEIKPENSSVKNFILEIIKSYPKGNQKEVEYLIDAYRAGLITRSKEEGKFIVGVLQLKDVLVIAHCKKDPSLAEIKDKMYSVKTVLHPKNIIRADIIEKKEGVFYFSAFEYSYKFSKSHAKFWSIEPEDVGWESLGKITFIIESETIDFPLQVSIDPEGIRELFNSKKISPFGKIELGREEGKITKVYLFGRCLSFPAFYDFYVSENEKLIPFKKKFEELIKPQTELINANSWYKSLYEEGILELSKIEIGQSKLILKKEHPRFVIGFFTKSPPGIKPKYELLWKIYQSIFENELLSFCHMGELIQGEPVKFGSFEVYNDIKINETVLNFLNSLLNQIQDCESKKIKLLLQHCFCLIALENIKNPHFKQVFSFLNNEIINKEIEVEFKNDGLLTKENFVEFKSADKVSSKPVDFTKEIVQEIKKYSKDGSLSRYCILYGVEDNNCIKPNYNFPSDGLSKIEENVDKEIKDLNLKTKIYCIPFQKGKIISAFIIPTRKNENSKI
jgi:hypothetical protein